MINLTLTISGCFQGTSSVDFPDLDQFPSFRVIKSKDVHIFKALELFCQVTM